MTAALRIATGRAGALLAFDGSVDDRANYDPETHGFVHVGRQDSFLRVTGFKRRFLPFEFTRRLAWRLGSANGVFAGCVVHLTTAGPACAGYDAANLVDEIPALYQIERTWTRAADDATVYFPRSIDDMYSIVNEDWHDAIVYFALSKAAGFIERLEEDDEWLVACDVTRAAAAVAAVAEAMGLPLQRDEEFQSSVAEAFASYVPELVVRDGHISVRRGDKAS